MLLIREGDRLLLFSQNGAEYESLVIYNGEFGPPDKFYFFLKLGLLPNKIAQYRVNELSCVVIVRPCTIMFKFGDRENIRTGNWVVHNTGRNDYPVDLLFNVVSSNMLSFIYSDLTLIVVYFEGLSHRIRTIDGVSVLNYDIRDIDGRRTAMSDLTGQELINEGIMKLPISDIYNFYPNNCFSVDHVGEDKLVNYALTLEEHNGNYTLKLISIQEEVKKNGIELIFRRDELRLYEDGNLTGYGLDYQGIVKCDYLKLIMLNNQKVLNYINDDNVMVILKENVDNFYILSGSSRIFAISEDKLIYKDLEQPIDWRVILNEGASGMRFTTESYYDYQLSKSFGIKSARK